MGHVHHIIPKHMKDDIAVMQEMGLEDINDPMNLTPPISVEMHAALHKDLFEHYGKAQDDFASRMLVGQSLSGFEQTPEMVEKIRQSNLGRIPWNKGKTGVYSEKTRKQISTSLLGNTCKAGTKVSEEGCINIGLAKRGNKNRLGQTFSTESREQIRLKLTGRKATPEAKANISLAQQKRRAREAAHNA